ncbi:MAG: glycosyltransferase family 2 protein [Gemmataceae bacterium]
MDSYSVIVPVHNNAAVVRRTLRSLDVAIAFLNREWGSTVPGEVVVVDDGSTDDSSRAVAEYGKDFKLVRRERASSPSCARNTGVSHSRGQLLFFLDGDDLFLPEHLYACYQTLADRSFSYVKTGVRLADPVHADWRPRIEFSVTINLCVRREVHDFVGGFPDLHLFRRDGDQFVHQTDIFNKIEDMFYNDLLDKLFQGAVVPRETVEYCRYPGNAYDRQYEKFCQPFGKCPEPFTEDFLFRHNLAMLLVDRQIKQLRQTRGNV